MRKINIVSIDLGTKNLIIKVNDHIVYDQSSLIVFDTESGQVFIGDEALSMRDSLPLTRILREPLQNGVIADVNALVALLTEIFINIVQVHNKQIWKKDFWKHSVVLIGIPSKIYRLDEDVLKETLQGQHQARIPMFSEKFKRYELFNNVMNASKIVMVPSVKLAAIGAGLSLWDHVGVFVLDIGAGTSDASILASGDVILQDSIPIGGENIDEDIKKYFETMHYLSISKAQAEEIKIKVGLPIIDSQLAAKVYELDTKLTIYGKSLKTGAPEKVIVERSEIEQVIAHAVEPIIELAKTIILRSPDNFSKTIQENGLVLTGGSALLQNIEAYFVKCLNLNRVVVVDNPLKATIKGTEIYEVHKRDLYEKGYIRPSK